MDLSGFWCTWRELLHERPAASCDGDRTAGTGSHNGEDVRLVRRLVAGPGQVGRHVTPHYTGVAVESGVRRGPFADRIDGSPVGDA